MHRIRTLHRVVLALSLFALVASEAAGGQPGGSFVPLWSVEGAKSNAFLGRSVAPAGDVNGDGYGDVIVGAFGDSVTIAGQGRVFLYLGTPGGLSNVAAWTYVGDQVNAYVGFAVAAAGDVNGDGYGDVILGIEAYDVAGVSDAGKAVVFHGGPAGLPSAPSRTLLPPAPHVEQNFGVSVAYAGDVDADGYDDVIVGAPRYSDAGSSLRGAAYVYRGGPTGLPASPSHTLLGRAQPGRFGFAVSTAGDMDADGYDDVIVGAPTETFAFAFSGAFSLYRGSAGGLLVAPDTTIGGGWASAQCGWSLAYIGDTTLDDHSEIVVGEPGAPYGMGLEVGRVRKFYGGPGGISSSDQIYGDNIVSGEHFGSRVASLGDVDGNGYPDWAASGRGLPEDNGRILIGLGDGLEGYFYGTLEPAPPRSAGYEAAVTFATSGDVDGDGRSEILMGDEFGTSGAFTNAGRVVLLGLPRALPVAAPAWPRIGFEAGARSGQSLAIVSGFPFRHSSALLIGEPGYNNNGVVTSHLAQLGSVMNLSTWTVAGSGSFFSLGSRVVDAGDMNRDGYVDVAISSPTADTQVPAPSPRPGLDGVGVTFQGGRVELYLGGQDVPAPPITPLLGGRDFDRVGSALAGRGDVNGDGYHDLLVGAEDWDSALLQDCGKVWVLYGGPNGVSGASWTLEGEEYARGLGAEVAFGDLDADGYSDVIISAVVAEGTPGNGRVQVHYGGPGGPSSTPGLVLGGNASPSYGRALAALGDVTGDGICDLGVGAPEEEGFGRAYVYAGTRGRSQRRAAVWSKPGTQLGGHYGGALAGGGDLDADGIADLVIGAPRWDAAQADEGRVEVYFGGDPAPSLTPALVLASGINGAQMGASFALSDLNEDGFADLAVGAPGAAGRVYAYLGSGGPGFTARTHVYDLLNGEILRRRPSPNLLELTNAAWPRTLLTTPGGRGLIQVEHEVRLQNEPFTGVPTFRDPTFYNSGMHTGIGASEYEVPGLLPGRGYHVRSRIVRRSPFFPRSRWITPDAQVTGNLDFRTSGAVVAVAPDAGALPAGPQIAGVRPNPSAGGDARIEFVLPAGGAVTLDVFDVRGARVRRLHEEAAAAGPGSAGWDGRDDAGRPVGAGIYFVELRAGGRTDRAKLVRLTP